MIKTKIINREMYEYYKCCDICGSLIHESFNMPVPRCFYCGIDLCENCTEHETSHGLMNHKRFWCKTCWDIHKEYMPKIKELEKEKNRLYDVMIMKCKHESKTIT
jgi:hypothetical protein